MAEVATRNAREDGEQKNHAKRNQFLS